MASTIIIKNGAGGSTPSSLKQGELAINVDSGSLYYGTSGSSNAVSSSFHFGAITASHLEITSTSGNGLILGSNMLVGSTKAIGYGGTDTKISGDNENLNIEGTTLHLTGSVKALNNIITDGAVSASGRLTGTELKIEGNGSTFATITTAGATTVRSLTTSGTGVTINNGDTTASLGYITASQIYVQDTDAGGGFYLLDNDGNNIAALARVGSGANAHRGRLVLRDNADVKVDIASTGTSYIMGDFSSSANIEANTFTSKTNGTTFFNVDIRGNITGSEISASGNLYAETLVGNGTTTELAVNGDISSSGELHGNSIAISHNGSSVFAVSNGGAVTVTDDITFPNAKDVRMKDSGGTARDMVKITSGDIGIFGNNTTSQRLSGLHTSISGSTGIDFMHPVTMSGVGGDSTAITAFGSISSSAQLAGTNLDIRSAGVAKASIDTEGGVTASAYQGTKHIIRAMSFYVNSNPLPQNGVFFGGTLQHQPSNWNDYQDVGGAIASTNTFTLNEDDMNWGHILPFDISKVEVQCSFRPALGNGDTYTLAIYTGSRQDDGDLNITCTKIGNQNANFSAAQYVSNDLSVDYNGAKGTMLFVGIGTSDSTDAKNGRGIMNITITQR